MPSSRCRGRGKCSPTLGLGGNASKLWTEQGSIQSDIFALFVILNVKQSSLRHAVSIFICILVFYVLLWQSKKKIYTRFQRRFKMYPPKLTCFPFPLYKRHFGFIVHSSNQQCSSSRETHLDPRIVENEEAPQHSWYIFIR